MSEISGITCDASEKFWLKIKGRKKICAHFVTRCWTNDQKSCRVVSCEDLAERADEERNFLKNIIGEKIEILRLTLNTT